MSLFLFVVLVVSVCSLLGISFGSNRNGGFDISRVLLGVALAPTFISLVAYASFMILSHWMPGRIIFIVLPLLAALALAGSGIRHFSGIAFRIPAGRWNLVPLALVLCGLPFLVTIWSWAATDFSAHDITLYLTEASDLSRIMREGSESFSDPFNYRHPVVVHPHSLSFSLYLAWGFLFEAPAGYGNDFIPKLLVGLTFLSVLSAAVSIVGKRAGISIGLAAGLVITMSALWSNEIRGLSRDAFYIGPAIVLAGLVLEQEARKAGLRLVGLQLLAALGVLLGHSIGIVLATALLAGCHIVLFARYRFAILTMPSTWVLAATLFVAAVISYLRYFGSGAANLGFTYPFYADPYQIQALKTTTPFAVEPSFMEFALKNLEYAQISPYWAIAVALAGVMVSIRIARKRLLRGTELLWCGMISVLLVSLILIGFMPLHLDGLSLAGAFVANFRYGFHLGLYALLVIMLSFEVIRQCLVVRLGLANTRGRDLLAFLAGAVVLNAWWAQVPKEKEDVFAVNTSVKSQNLTCSKLQALNPRRVLVDNVGRFYTCSGNLQYVFTNEGVRITGAENDSAIRLALDAASIDAIVLDSNIQMWWSGTRLYHYLLSNWTHFERLPGAPDVFVRPRV
ncbi:hypothetical protein [Rhizobium sp. BK418]|uniref:hypothetical protein n=1 Tax=Rhizobium sp. BK418 TaxID=2512120 RepID=UPI0010465408|nr:hypothetical protein [Rhizobium sp. BK418]TCS01256.1 hypothetical protein EV281_1061 [Rhizobium sp. BK418]